MASLSASQIETLIRSTKLSDQFRRLLESMARKLRNESRKLIKANSADQSYHEASFNAEQKAINFMNFASKYHRLLSDNKSIEKGMLVDAIADFDYPESLTSKNTDSEILEIISVATYNHPSLGEVNVFNLIVDQAFEESQLKAISN